MNEINDEQPIQCQWCGAAVKEVLFAPAPGVVMQTVFTCGVSLYENEGENGWPRVPTYECGIRCAERLQRLKERLSKIIHQQPRNMSTWTSTLIKDAMDE